MSLVAGSRVWGNFEFDVIDVIRNPGGVTSAHATPSACLGIKMAAVLARPIYSPRSSIELLSVRTGVENFHIKIF
jgi:hypothetical protein